MIAPLRDVELPGGIRCQPATIGDGAWIAHLIKHVLGIDANARRPKATAWNREGWETLTPPLIDAAQRDRLLRHIADLEVAGERCAIPEVRSAAAASAPVAEACYACPRPLASQCARAVDDVSSAYAAVTSSLVERFDVSSCVAAPRVRVIKTLAGLFAHYDAWSSLALLSVGLDARTRSHKIAHVSRADGVRAEFYLEAAKLRWRTTWRNPPIHPAQAMSFLLDFAPSASSSTPLSEVCLVDRLWWDRHAL